MTQLTQDENVWLDWVRSLPENLRRRHDLDQGLSLSAFNAGVAAGIRAAGKAFRLEFETEKDQWMLDAAELRAVDVGRASTIAACACRLQEALDRFLSEKAS